ncbi:diphosphomevalonate decarboxylase [Nevskia sp.]|uniref:diphosphomevalonate decarboxylase n=1 Tax=Nevskia sp. TaxID=1929292 RepID=UPI0025D5CD57|nr:diphosphomevalonate decarboxylase [Nevskia sp.]
MSTSLDADSCAAAQAHPNIALIKYWGKRDLPLNLPVVGSLSITLDTLWTRTSVRFGNDLLTDRLSLNGREDAKQLRKVSACLDLLRARAGTEARAEVVSHNNFPTGAGLASSASGFAALVVAADAALGLGLPQGTLSEFARRGSGSASRSIFGGYVEWALGERPDGEDSVARPILDAQAWPLRVAVAITSTAEKAIGSTEGMNRTADTSPYQRAWIDTQEADLAEARAAIVARDFERLADISEFSCLKMHALAMAAKPGLLYWNAATMAAMHAVRALRASGVPVFFTIDAGPQVKAICLPSAAVQVAAALREVPGVLKVLETGLGGPAKLIPVTEAEAA